LPFDLAQKIPQRRLVRCVSRQNLVGERQTFGRDHQRDHHLHAVGPMVARIAEASFVALGERRLGLEIRAGQIVEQQIEARGEQVAPPLREVFEQRLLVLQKPVVTAVELVDLGEPEIAAQKIGQRGPFEPLPMQPPLAARRQQPVGDQHEKFLVPARALAARRQALQPEPVEPQFLPERKREPAGAPLPRPAEPQLRQLQPNDRRVRQRPRAAVFGKQRQSLRPIDFFVQHIDRPAPRQFLRVVDLAEVKNMLLNDPPARNALAFDNAPIAMPLAVLLANLLTQKHADPAFFTNRQPGK
jgi:hypothetical protein